MKTYMFHGWGPEAICEYAVAKTGTVEAPDDAVLTCLNTGESERAVNG